jgi:hypothetical protein
MDAPALSVDEARELAALRQRAYGPGSGIAPEAIARLEELEAASRHASPVQSAAALVQTPTETARSTARDHPATEDPSDSDGAGEAAAASASREGRADATGDAGHTGRAPNTTVRWIVGGGAVLVILLIAAIVWGVTQITGTRSDITLAVVPTEADTGRAAGQEGFLNSYGVDLESITQFEDYRALTAWSAPTDSGGRCLVVDAAEFGTIDVRCTPRGLDPIVDVMIWEGMPTGMMGGLPPGSVIRFVLEGDSVLVWERAADTDL